MRECGPSEGMGRAAGWKGDAWERKCETEWRRDTDEDQPRQSGIGRGSGPESRGERAIDRRLEERRGRADENARGLQLP